MDAFHNKRYDTHGHSTSPSTPPTLGKETLDEYTSSRSHPSLAAFVREEKAPTMSVKWASQVFPSFVVSSANKSPPDAQKSKTSSTKVASKKQPSQASRSRHMSPKTPLPFHEFDTRSIPLISPSGMATKSEFRHLLRHQTQVNFHNNSRVGFRYETLCLQGHNTNSSNSTPVAVVGPWITTH